MADEPRPRASRESERNLGKKRELTNSKLEVGDLVDGQYRITEILGRGGMGAVYRATDERLKRDVAVKVIHSHLLEGPKSENLMKRFEREAVLLANLVHPNIIAVYDTGVHEGNNYIVLEYVEGKNLGEVLKDRKRFEPYKAILIIVEILRGMAYAHSRHVIHRDLKPANIMISATSGIKIMDFGLAKALTGQNTPLTRAGQIMGTTYYMPPELVRFQTSDPRGDVYSLGCILYEMVTGTVPFKGRSTGEVLTKVIKERPLPPTTRNPALDPELDEVLLAALEKDPELRYQSAEEFEAALILYLTKHGYDLPEEMSSQHRSSPRLQPTKPNLRDIKSSSSRLSRTSSKRESTNERPAGGETEQFKEQLAALQSQMSGFQKERYIYQGVIVVLLVIVGVVAIFF